MRFVNVKKENGDIEKFDESKLKKSIIIAFDKAGYINYESHVEAVYDGVIRQLEEFPGVFRPTTSQLGSVIEDTFVYLNHTQPAKTYMLYRNNKQKIRGGSKAFIDSVDNYLSQSDWRVKENSNVSYSIGGLILHSAGALASNYWLNEVYTKDIRDAHISGDIHIHDLSMLASYCNGNDLLQLIQEGLGGVQKQITSKPPKHLRTLIDQMVNHLGIMQNEFAGAQAYSSFDTFLAPYIKHEKLSYEQVKQNIQHFVFGINVPSRWGSQPPFVNITLDWVVPSRYKVTQASVGAMLMDFTYADCQDEMDMINKAFLEVMEEGDATGKGFAYPIPTYNITKEFDWNNKNIEMLFKLTSKFGTPYFSNFINSDMDVEDSFSMCCRLRLDKSELRRRGGGLFGADSKTGSVGVVTINLPRLAFKSKKMGGDVQKNFMEGLTRLMELSKISLELKREAIDRFMEDGLYPYTTRYLGTFKNHFSTIGIVGGNEACLNLFGKNITDPDSQVFVVGLLNHMRDKMSEYQSETGNLYNLEATPAEGTSFRLAKIDCKEYGKKIITAGTFDAPYYTNSTQLPVGHTTDIFDALDIQDQFQSKYTGGTVLHAFLGEAVPNWKTTAKLVRKVFENYRLPYLSITPTYSICPVHGYLYGEQFTCKKCEEDIRVLDSEIKKLEEEKND